MPLEEFVGRNVTAGEPVTAAGWNEIVDGLRAVNTHVRTDVAAALTVSIGNTQIDPQRLLVTADREDAPQVFAAVRDLTAESLVYTFAALPAAVYTVRAAAPGFAVASQSLIVPDDSELALTLTPEGGLMPNLFGLSLQEGLKQLADRAIEVSRVLDITGRDVPPAAPGPDYAAAPILAQTPGPGEAVPLSGNAQLAIAATLREEPSVEMPSLSGLTLAEARKALESLGLTLGEVVTRKS